MKLSERKRYFMMQLTHYLSMEYIIIDKYIIAGQ